MYLHGFVPSCPRPFAESRVFVGDHSCPPDFGPPQADEFFHPLDNKKGFPHPDLNFFTSSPPEAEAVEVGDIPYYVSIQSGRIASIDRGPFPMRPWRFAIRAKAEAWEKLWEPVPRPGYTDILGMMKIGEARIEGDLQPFMANLRYLKEILVPPRRLRGRC